MKNDKRKMKNERLLLFLIPLLFPIVALGDHIEVSGEVSGEWNTDTVLVTGNLIVPEGHNLHIMPGTIVEFQGSFVFSVQGSVTALGSEKDNICFQVADTAGFSVDSIPDGGWQGIRFDHNRITNDSSIFVNCRFSYGKMAGNDPLTSHGGVIGIDNFNKIRIEGCIFNHNFAVYNGGAVNLDSSNIAIWHSTFSGNRCGPAVSPYGYGGAVCSDYSNPDIRWNVFEGNSSTGVGGGLAVRFTDCNLYNNIFSNNTSGLGGGFGFLHIPEIQHRIINNLVTGNYAVYFGGGVANLEASPIYINNTIVYNDAMFGGGFYCKDSVSPGFYNTIIWGNTAGVGPQGYLFEIYAQAGFFNCDVQGGPLLFGGSGGGVAFSGAWENCLDTLPDFAGSGDFPWSLNESSPCINMGSADTSGFMLPDFDLAGNPRIFNGVIDMGAYEYSAVGVKEESGADNDYHIWPNPTRGEFKVQSSKFKAGVLEVKIIDSFGRVVLSREFLNASEPVEFDISHLPPGIYVVRILADNEYLTKLLIKGSHR